MERPSLSCGCTEIRSQGTWEAVQEAKPEPARHAGRRRGIEMPREITGPTCGEVVRANGDEELVPLVQGHAKERHGSDVCRHRTPARIREA